MNTAYIYIFGTVLCTVYGQLILKWRIVKYGALPEAFIAKIMFLLKLFYDPFIISGFISAFIAAMFWMAAMTKFELSVAYPLIVGGLAILSSIFAVLLLKEPLNVYKAVGIILIVSGLYMISKT